jgi:hypothetical protein
MEGSSNNLLTFKNVLLAGLAVGTLDILSAFTDYYISTGNGPSGVLSYVASGVFGKDAFSGDGKMIYFGLLFHYVFAFLFTLIFFLIYPKIGWLYRNRILTGFLYGLFIWVVMNLVVVQLSNAPHVPISAIDPLKAMKSYLILVFMIGLPLSFIARGLKQHPK